jgi:hypothetical protein
VARQRLVVADFRVQNLERRGGWRSFTILGPDGRVHEEADQFLLVFEGSGTQRTYAHYLVDYLRWRAREGLDSARVTLRDLERYLGAVGAKATGPFGEPWRVGKRPYGASALATAAACVKGFYLHHAARREPGAGADLQASRQRDELNAAWRERALNAEDALIAANREIRLQRQRIADLMGQARDLEHTWSHDGLQRLVTENTTLKQRVRQVTEDNQILTDKLAAARSNARFLDRRIADLELQLLEPTEGLLRAPRGPAPR